MERQRENKKRVYMEMQQMLDNIEAAEQKNEDVRDREKLRNGEKLLDRVKMRKKAALQQRQLNQMPLPSAPTGVPIADTGEQPTGDIAARDPEAPDA